MSESLLEQFNELLDELNGLQSETEDDGFRTVIEWCYEGFRSGQYSPESSLLPPRIDAIRKVINWTNRHLSEEVVERVNEAAKREKIAAFQLKEAERQEYLRQVQEKKDKFIGLKFSMPAYDSPDRTLNFEITNKGYGFTHPDWWCRLTNPINPIEQLWSWPVVFKEKDILKFVEENQD